MTSNDIKQVKFEVMVDKIVDAISSHMEHSLFGVKRVMFQNIEFINGSESPLGLIYDYKKEEGKRRYIIDKGRIYSSVFYKEEDYKQLFSEEFKGKVESLKELVRFLDLRIGDNYKCSVVFIFWSLLLASLDKSDYEEKISIISDLAYLLGLDEDALIDIIEVIKIIFGEEKTEYHRFFKRENLLIFNNVISLFGVKSIMINDEIVTN